MKETIGQKIDRIMSKVFRMGKDGYYYDPPRLRRRRMCSCGHISSSYSQFADGQSLCRPDGKNTFNCATKRIKGEEHGYEH